MKINFEIADDEFKEIKNWSAVILKKLHQKQISECRDCQSDKDCEFHFFGPYLGAIGGGISYTFTPTSIGTMISVECCGEKLFVSTNL